MGNTGGSAVDEAPATEREDPLLTASEVGKLLGIPHKRVYELDIAVIQISSRTLRWKLSDVVQWREKRRKVR